MCVDDASPAVVARNHVSGYDVAFCVQTHGARVLHNHVERTCIGTYVDPGITGAMVKGNVYGPTNPACGVAPGFGAYGTYGIILDGSIGATVTRNRIVGQHSAAGAVGLAVRSQASGNVVKGNVLRGNDLDLDAADAGPGNTIVRNRCATSVPDGLCG
jgi:nitrous oxidase accessory protein NosD